MTSAIFAKKIMKDHRITIPPEIITMLELESGELVKIEITKL